MTPSGRESDPDLSGPTTLPSRAGDPLGSAGAGLAVKHPGDVPSDPPGDRRSDPPSPPAGAGGRAPDMAGGPTWLSKPPLPDEDQSTDRASGAQHPVAKTEPLQAAAPPAPRRSGRMEDVRGRTRVGLYEVLEELGRGGMGTVYKAWHPLKRVFVALKVISCDPSAVERYQRLRDLFLRESAILMSVEHENIVRCTDANEASHEGKPTLYMALELLEGEPLTQVISRGALPLAEALRVAKCIARALEALHGNAQPILHRDLKPGNVFLTRTGGVKLLDFGLAAVADWHLSHVSVFAAGSRPYMSPEQFDGLRACTARSDLYSLGVTLFHMATGQVPFMADTDEGFLKAHRDRSPPSLLEKRPELAGDPLLESTQNIVTRLLAKRPDERYPSALEVVDAIGSIEAGRRVERPRVTRPEWLRWRRWTLLGLAVVALVATIAKVGAVVAGSSATRRLEEVPALRERHAFEDARKVVVGVLEQVPQDKAAGEMLAEIERKLEAQRAAREAQRLADDARREGRWLDCARSAASASKIAREADAFERAELDALERAAHDAEAARRERFEALLEGAHRILGEGSVEDAAKAIEAAGAAARLDDEQVSLDELRSELRKAQETVADIASSLEEADRALQAGTGLERALGGVREARAALEKGGAPLERRAGRTRAQVRAVESALERAMAVEAVRSVERSGDARRILDAVAAARKAGAGTDPEERKLLESAAAKAKEALFDEAMKGAAAPASTPAELARGEAAAREAMRLLPPGESERFLALARSFEERKHAGERVAADALRDALKDLPHARRAWQRLAEIAAIRGRHLDEQLVLPAERVELGDDDPSSKNPRHPVSLQPFYLHTLEADMASYAAYVVATSATPPAVFVDGSFPPGRAQYPVRGIGFGEAKAYAHWRGERLPTADEWEYAAGVEPQGGLRLYPWGKEWLKDVIVPGAPEPRAAGSHALDVSPWGCRDMGGNVAEWTTEDRTELVAVLKGAGYDETEPYCRVTYRRRPYTSPSRYSRPRDVGLRCARDVPPPDLSELAR